jgi:hypothetical protein
MRLAYLLILVPAAIVGLCYFAIFHSLGMQVHPAPFVGAVVAFAAAILAVRYYHRRKAKRPDN